VPRAARGFGPRGFFTSGTSPDKQRRDEQRRDEQHDEEWWQMNERTSELARLFAVEPENDWRSSAACRGLDPDVFFADDFENKQERAEREALAKAVCQSCEVSEDCLGYALKAGERYGIWGGLNAQERRALSRKLPPPSAGERVS
jgi:WhiB family transcriptional regulator, redox-sensing transcriptional regulator